MKKVFQLLYVVLTMENLVIQRCLAIFIGIILAIVLCKFASIKTVIGVACIGVFLVIIGTIFFFSGLIEGWTLLSLTFPFSISFAIVATIFYAIIHVRQ